MTRETKIGLVVATSFLCLVGIVVASKWKRGDTPGGEEEQAVKVAAAKLTQAVGDPKPDAKKPETTPMFPPPAPPMERKDVAPPMPVPQADPPKLQFPPISAPPPMKDIKPGDFPPFGSVIEAKPVAVPPIEDKKMPPMSPMIEVKPEIPLLPDKKPFTFPPIPEPKKDGMKPPVISVSPIDDKKTDVTIAPLTEKPGPSIPSPLGGNTPAKKDDITMPPVFGGLPPKKEEVPPTPPFGGLPPKKDDITVPPAFGGLPPKKEEVPPTPPFGGLPPKKDDITVPPVFGGLPPKKEEVPPTPPFGGLPPKKDEIPSAPPFGGLPKKDDGSPGTFSFPALKEVPKKDPPGPPTVTDKKDSFPPPPVISFGSKEPTGPERSVPPTVIGGPPRVSSFNMESTEFKAGEMTFSDLSKRIYQTDKYGAALLQYNRDHRGLIKNGAAFEVNPPYLSIGQQVLYPPKAILERDYGKLIPGLASPVSVPPVSTSPPVRITPPVVLDPRVAPAAAPLSNPGTYVVQGQGERIRDIARRFLGNADRWTDIYNLNRNIQPQFPIPPGTQLKLPTN